MISIRGDRCCYVLHSTQSRKRAWKHWEQRMSSRNCLGDQKSKLLLKKHWIPQKAAQLGSPICLWMIFFGVGRNEMEQRVLTRLRTDFQVGSEDWNNVTFTRQRIRWTQAPETGSYLEVRVICQRLFQTLNLLYPVLPLYQGPAAS